MKESLLFMLLNCIVSKFAWIKDLSQLYNTINTVKEISNRSNNVKEPNVCAVI